MKIDPTEQSLADNYQKPPSQVHIITDAKSSLLVAIDVMGRCAKKHREDVDVGKDPLVPLTSVAVLL